MKYLITLLIMLSSALSFGALKELDMEWDLYNDVEIKEYFVNLRFEQQAELVENLRAVKVSLLKGEIDTALEILRIDFMRYEQSPIELLIRRYLALSYFVIGNYQETLRYLNHPSFDKVSYYKNICILKIASLLHLGKTEQLLFDLSLCESTNIDLNGNDFVWLSHIKDYIFNRSKVERFFKNLVLKLQTYVSNDHTRAWLKFGILFNYEQLVEDNLAFIPEQAYGDINIRALMGFILYKNGKDSEALEFIEDLTTSNALYLKAILSAKKGKMKTAYAHGKSALNRRKFSINANQLMSSLAWLNNKWKEGRYAVNKVPPTKDLLREQKLLNLAFLVKEKNFYRAKVEIEELFFDYNRKMPFEALVIESLINLTLADKKWKSSSDNACLRFDGVNCWLHLQTYLWDDYATKIKEFGTEKGHVLGKLDALTTRTIAPDIEEAQFINQRDILELDIELDANLDKSY